MAHEIENMFFRGEVPWHGLGVPVTGALTTESAIAVAGLDWTVSKERLKTADGVETDGFATRRSDTGAVLGVVGPKYSVLQNVQAFTPFEPYLASGEVELQTAGALRGGKRIWILAEIKRDPSVIVPQADDKIVKYLLLSNSHDGTLAVRFGFTPIRVVCANTLALAHGAGGSKLIRILHRGNVVQSVEAVRETLNLANAAFEATADQYRRLAARSIVAKDLEEYVKVVFAQRDAQRSNVLSKVQPLFEHGRGNDLPGVRGTMWAAYNAVTEYLQHERGDDRDRRLDSSWFGSGAALNARALEKALEVA